MRLKIEQWKVRILQDVMQMTLCAQFGISNINQFPNDNNDYEYSLGWQKKPVAKRYVYKTAIDACIEVC